MRRLPAVAAAPAALAAAVLLAAGWRALWIRAFVRNPRFGAKTVEIQTGVAKTAEEIRDITGLREGVNLFSFRADEIRRRILDSTLNVAEAEISKELPGTVRIAVRDRVPAARLFADNLAVDAEGLVFTILAKDADRWHDLPRIECGAQRLPFDPGRRLAGTPGTPVGAEARIARALDVVNAAGAGDLPFRILGLDVSGEVYLSLQMADWREVRLVWEEIPDRASIVEALSLAGRALSAPGADAKSRFDVLLSVRKVYAR